MDYAPTIAAEAALVRAHGHFVTLVAVLLNRAGVATLGEMMRIYAESLAKDDLEEGAILADWAKTLQALASGQASH